MVIILCKKTQLVNNLRSIQWKNEHLNDLINSQTKQNKNKKQTLIEKPKLLHPLQKKLNSKYIISQLFESNTKTNTIDD